MDTLMFVITGLSVVVAAAASFVAWRATDAERRRSTARIAALAAAADVETQRDRLREHAPEVVDTPDGLHEFMAVREAVTASTTASTGALLGMPVADSGSGGRQHGLLAAAAIVFVLVGGGSLALLLSGRAPSVAGAPAGVPLELVTLGHARPDGQLAISGLVHNPAGGSVVEQLEAHVRVFDAAGILIATRSAPVDAAALAPGADGPFTVTFGETSTAARYRVSFASRGTMLAHVDRRTHLPAAVTADAR